MIMISRPKIEPRNPNLSVSPFMTVRIIGYIAPPGLEVSYVHDEDIVSLKNDQLASVSYVEEFQFSGISDFKNFNCEVFFFSKRKGTLITRKTH